jgi:ubiquinone/menaquinone biosynthesis C-methylase UbiE
MKDTMLMSPYHRVSSGLSVDEIQQKYNAFAPWYNSLEGLLELSGLRSLRRNLLQQAAENVLEVAVGTGQTLPYYPPSCRLTAVDVSPAMLALARKRAMRLGRRVAFQVMDAEHLAFPDHSFHTVVDTLAICTFPQPVAALREMARVCKPEGRLLLLEHGRSHRAWLGRLQDRWAARHAAQLGCWWNREPLALVRQAGLQPLATRRTFFGIFQVMEVLPTEAMPAATGQG